MSIRLFIRQTASILFYLPLQAAPSQLISLPNTEIKAIHEVQIPPQALTLPSEEIDAFGLPAGSRPHSIDSSKTVPSSEQATLTLESVATQLRLQGVSSDGEVIINALILKSGEKLKTKMGQDSFEVLIKEVHESSVLVGWNKSDSTYLLQLPELQDPVTLSETSSAVFTDKELTLTPMNSSISPQESIRSPSSSQSKTALSP